MHVCRLEVFYIFFATHIHVICQCYFHVIQEIDNNTPKKERDDTLRAHKVRLQQRQKEAEERQANTHKDAMEFELRKFKRRKLMSMHKLMQDQLRDVSD